jgi:deoxyhypusine synthase
MEGRRAEAGGPDGWLVRRPVDLVTEAGAGDAGGIVPRLLARMRQGAFQGRQLGQAFEAWTRMIDRGQLIAMGLAGSLASAGLWPLLTWLVERGYVDVLASTCANATEDLLEQRGARLFQVDPEHVDDAELHRLGYYRFYDHVVSAADYDAMEDFTRGFFEHLAATWPEPVISGARFMRELGGWLDAQGLGRSLAATCFRHGVPLFVPAAPDGPLAEGYRAANVRRPTVDFYRDFGLLLEILGRFAPPGPGTAAIYLGGGVPKDFLQIAATSVPALRGAPGTIPHRAAIQITTDNAVYGGLGGASVAGECLSWGKEAADGDNVMVYADVTIALPLLCQGLLEHYGPAHTRPARGAIAAELQAILVG